MPSRGSGLAVAVASTTFSPKRTTAAPWACLASFPVSMESCFPPASSTETFVASGFIGHPFVGAKGQARGHGVRVDRRMPGGGWERTLLRLTMVEPAPPGAGRSTARFELQDYRYRSGACDTCQRRIVFALWLALTCCTPVSSRFRNEFDGNTVRSKLANQPQFSVPSS